MESKDIIELAKEFPRSKCLRCTNFQLRSLVTDSIFTTSSKLEAICIKELEPLTCGRSFNPKSGGDLIPA